MTETAYLARPEPVRDPHPKRAWANAKFFESMDWYMHRRLGARKQALFADLPSHVVELGSGAGASLRYLPRGSSLVAVEPNLHAHDALRRTAARYGIDLEIRGGAGRVDRSAERERRRGDLHARAVHGRRPGRRARGSAPHPAPGRTLRVHRARRVRSGPAASNTTYVAPAVALRLRRLLSRPRHRRHYQGGRLRRGSDPALPNGRRVRAGVAPDQRVCGRVRRGRRVQACG